MTYQYIDISWQHYLTVYYSSSVSLYTLTISVALMFIITYFIIIVYGIKITHYMTLDQDTIIINSCND